jgi:choline dehydrogenase
MSRPNLKVITGVHVRRIVFEKNVARGVEFRQRGTDRIEMATHSIILSAGAVRSPQILMLSGVGPVEQLRKFDIPVVMGHPGVGLNHMEHPAAGVMYEVALSTWNKELPIHRQMYHGVRWLLRKSGPAASGYCHAVAFIRTDSALTRPDLQINLLPVGIVFDENKKRFDSSRNMVNVLVNSCRPLGRGRLELASANPVDPPLIFPRLLDGEATVDTMIKGIEIVRGIFNSPAMRPYVKREVTPGIGQQTRSDLTAWLRGATVDMSHPSGTCKMGQDGLAVVDERLRVRGVQNLRVADASIMPVIPSGNTNAPTVMIAEKAAQMILEDQ